MTYAIRYQPEAEEDIEQAVTWYEKERAGLGSDFIDDLADAEVLLAEVDNRVHKHRLE